MNASSPATPFDPIPPVSADTQALVPRRRSLSWLPAVIAMPVTVICVLLCVANLASAALYDSGPRPHPGWYVLDLFTEIALGLAALGLVVLSQVKSSGQRAITVLGCAVIAAAVLAYVISATLGTPS